MRFFVLNSTFTKLDSFFSLNIQFAKTPKSPNKLKFSINHLDIILQVMNPPTHQSLPERHPRSLMSSTALRVALLSFSLMSPSDLNSAWISSQMTHPGGQAWKLLSPPSHRYQLGKQAHPQRSSSKQSRCSKLPSDCRCTTSASEAGLIFLKSCLAAADKTLSST